MDLWQTIEFMYIIWGGAYLVIYTVRNSSLFFHFLRIFTGLFLSFSGPHIQWCCPGVFSATVNVVAWAVHNHCSFHLSAGSIMISLSPFSSWIAFHSSGVRLEWGDFALFTLLATSLCRLAAFYSPRCLKTSSVATTMSSTAEPWGLLWCLSLIEEDLPWPALVLLKMY